VVEDQALDRAGGWHQLQAKLLLQKGKIRAGAWRRILHGINSCSTNNQPTNYRFGDQPKMTEKVMLRADSTVTLSPPLIGVGPVVLNGSV
jgi:hypothetical protein